ncbi:MAG: amino acid permease, partial [Deltaproteobacteria bacterium]|nr:amino acid permease [Deltaproteobacteria bacterium]
RDRAITDHAGPVSSSLMDGDQINIAEPDRKGADLHRQTRAATLTTGLGATLGRWMVWMVMVAMWFCGLSSVTPNSRMLFAFARDGGLPGSALLARVSPPFQSPHVAVWVSAVAAFVVALWARAYAAMVALSTLTLYASYALPVLAALRDGKLVRRGPWQLGRWTGVVRVLAVTWVAIVTVLFVLPPNQLAGYTFAGSVAAIAVYWFAWMKPRFKGPPRLPPL